MLLAANTANAEVNLPENHPGRSFIAKFRHHLQCPYADQWLSKGPIQASFDLGLTSSTGRINRHLQQDSTGEAATVAGSCSFPNAWSGTNDCLEFRGTLWTSESMEVRCSGQSDSANFVEGQGCPVPTPLAGWCWLIPPPKDGNAAAAMEVQPLTLPPAGPMADCNSIQSVCEGMMSGTWEPDGVCTAEGGEEGDTANAAPSDTGMPEGVMFGAGAGGPPTSGGSAMCEIAPGPIGAAHQAGYSPGYLNNCEGTPAESSPYMWPVAWTALNYAESMSAGSDEIKFTTMGQVFYRLDKNWKRSDTFWSQGINRFLGQGPCDNPVPNDEEEGDGFMLAACNRTTTERTTMIHRGSKMMFIDWNENTTDFNDAANIASCRWLDLAVVGNVRPDWFMDDRGDSTDVQYMGDQHVYHDGKPRLVKQWRKVWFVDTVHCAGTMWSDQLLFLV